MFVSALILAAAAAATTPALSPTLSPADSSAAFRAAGFKRVGRQWQRCEDPGGASYTPGEIETVHDLNGDGRLEAIIVEGSSFCHGNTGAGYTLVSRQSDERWIRMADGTGMIEILKTRGVGNWPDLSIGAPGFCFPVERWNGKAYALHRFQYEGRPCKPKR